MGKTSEKGKTSVNFILIPHKVEQRTILLLCLADKCAEILALKRLVFIWDFGTEGLKTQGQTFSKFPRSAAMRAE